MTRVTFEERDLSNRILYHVKNLFAILIQFTYQEDDTPS